MKTLALSLFLTLPFAALAADELPAPVKQIEKQGIEIIKPFDAPGGLRGWLGRYQGMGVAVYLTPDGKHAISGYMYDEDGNNLSEKLFQNELYAPEGRKMWERLLKTPAIKEGRADAPRTLVVFADPFCPYCKKFWQMAQPWVSSGKVQMRTLLVGVIKPESGRYAAAILSAKNPAEAWQHYEASNGKTVPPFPASTEKAVWDEIQLNQKLMDDLGANATPAIYYLNAKRELQQVVGLPDDEQLKAMLGDK
ncbi:thiol:disulfide interchange protein DsbG [Enterobacteriaceae bacterium 4M9]|nr:thiol:disulfide interchange protein DsbG [Enterobacteriaceae bacterium 4M9]